MILGIKSRWNELTKEIFNISKHVELHQNLEDINELFDKQSSFLKKHDKIFHIHHPFRNEDNKYVCFSKDYRIIEKCVELGDIINEGRYHLVCHPLHSSEKIISNAKKLLNKSKKVIICFENLSHSYYDFTRAGEFIKLFEKIDDERVKLCLDICHTYLVSNNVFDNMMNKLSDKICHVHVAGVGKKKEHGVQIRTGIINWKHVFKKLRELKKDTVIIPEITNGHLNHHKNMIKAHNIIKKNLF